MREFFEWFDAIPRGWYDIAVPAGLALACWFSLKWREMRRSHDWPS